MIYRLFMRSVALLALATLVACTEPNAVRLPPEKTIHFPSIMSLKDNILAIGASSDDERYNFGRLVTIDTNTIKKQLDTTKALRPISFESSVVSNVMIPPGIGEIRQTTGGRLLFTTNKNGKLYAQKLTGGLPACNGAELDIDACKNSHSFKLNQFDPFLLGVIDSTQTGDLVAVGYLSSSKIDVVKTDEQGLITSVRSLDLMDFLKRKHKSSSLEHARFMTRKILVGQSANKLVHFLIQPHLEGIADPNRNTQEDTELLFDKRPKILEPNRPPAELRKSMPKSLRSLGSFILSLPAGALAKGAPIADQDIGYHDLNLKHDIFRAQDFFIDDEKGIAYILGKAPESLYKINLADDALLDMNFLCIGATSMTVATAWNMIFVPCYTDNMIASFSTDRLHILSSSRIQGRGPTHVVADEKNNLVFATFSLDGRVIIFNKELDDLGFLFEQAPSNKVGSK